MRLFTGFAVSGGSRVPSISSWLPGATLTPCEDHLGLTSKQVLVGPCRTVFLRLAPCSPEGSLELPQGLPYKR